VPLGAEDVEPAGLAHALPLLLGERAHPLDLDVPRLLVLLRRVHRGEPALAEVEVRDDVRVATQHDVGATSRHVGRHRDRARPPGLGDDLRLGRVELGVEHVVLDALAGEQLGEVLTALDGGGAHEHRLLLLDPLGDVLDDGAELGLLGLVDEVALVLARHGPVGRDGHDLELVDLVQLGRLGLGGARHAGQLLVEPEVVLERDGGEGLVLRLDLDPLLGLDGLVHALVVAATVQHAAGELVDDDHLAVADDVVLVLGEQLLGLDGVVQVAHQWRVGGLVQVVDPELVLDELDTQLGHPDRPLLAVDLVVRPLLEEGGDAGELGVPLARPVGRAGDDERRAGLVDEDRVDLVDDRVVVPALHELRRVVGHVVAQVVEPELVVGAVGDVGRVGLAALRRGHPAEDRAHGQAEEAMHPAHPLRVALGQVVVDRDHVHALAGQAVEVRGEHTREGLALTGLHLRDRPRVQDDRADDLHLVRLLTEDPVGGLAGHRERLRQEVVERLTLAQPPLELVGLRAELVVGQRLRLVGERVHVVGEGAVPLELPAFAGPEQLGKDGHSLERPRGRGIWRPSRSHGGPGPS
jgi:hypothetical protein